MITTPDTETAHLTTGWEPDLDPADTVLHRFALHEAEHYAAAARAAGGVAEVHDHVCLADTGRPSALYNTTFLTQPPPVDGWDDLMDTVEDFYDGGRGDVGLISPWPTPDLSARGWHLIGHPPLLVRRPGGPLPPATTDLRVVAVDDAGGLDDWARVAVDGFPFRELQPYRPGRLFTPAVLDDPRWRFWVAYDDDRAVSIGALFVARGFAQLALGVTLPQARGRGAWYALVRERLLAAGDTISGGLFSDDSRPGIEKLGYLPITRFTYWERPRR